MKNKLYFLVVLFLVPFFLTACTLDNNSKKDAGDNSVVRENENEGEKTNAEVVSDTEDVKGSLMDLAKLGKNAKCTFEFENEDGKSVGETFVSGNKVSSNFTIETSDEERINSYTISDGEWMYMWSSANDQGTKIKITELENKKNETTNTAGEEGKYNDYSNEVNYKCKVWVPDNSKFSPPTDITFTDLTDTMNQFMDPENLKSLCGMCNSMDSEEEILQCKERLGCE